LNFNGFVGISAAVGCLAIETSAIDRPPSAAIHKAHLQAISNLMVLARESESGAQRVWADGAVVSKLLGIIRNDPSEEVVVAAVRALDELVKDPTRVSLFLYVAFLTSACFLQSMKFMQLIGIPEICRLLCARPWQQYLDASGLIVQRLFNALAKMNRTKEIKPDPDVAEGAADRRLLRSNLLSLQQTKCR
jgi:hypothetical protein